MTSIRAIGPDDWQAFRAIRVAALTDSPAAFGSTLEDAEQRSDEEWQAMVRARCTSDASAIWLAEAGDASAIGVVAADHDTSTGHTELVSMWVTPESRGSGVARKLIDRVVEWALATGATAVSLWVMRGNDPVVRFYEKAGFEVTHDHRAAPDDPCKDEIRMTLPVTLRGAAAGRAGTR